ncbi:MAG: hypothetical protein OEO82_03510 [Gammaproteobacteria bacterium]|nr:hypothetical protein [Gammaproteobacteria bacterium]
MSTSLLQIGPFLFAALAGGALIGWLLRGASSKRSLEKERDKWTIKFDEAARQRDSFIAENNKLKAKIESQQATVHKHEQAASKMRTAFESALEKMKSLSKDLFTAQSERDAIKGQINDNQFALTTAQQKLTALEAEFVKSGEIYKSELEKAFEKRKSLENKLADARAEHESLTNLLESSRSEYESVNKMLAAAQTRLHNLDAMEAKVIALEAENAEFRHGDAKRKQEIEALRRDVAELEELKVQNKELAHCLKSMENSRRQYEIDAKRYREQADQSEQRSETLRMKLDDVEKSFATMASQHDQALKVATQAEATPKTNGEEHASAAPEVDDLTEIVGIGKVFAQTLHDLGIYSYRQIANFGPADIARVNVELKEFKGRMEQDDWIGQARELYYKKYSERYNH